MKTDPCDPGAVIRAFVAVEISDEVRAGLAKAQADLSSEDCAVKWVEPHNIHLTILFLGAIFEGGTAQFIERLDEIAKKTAPFRYDVAGLGFFGSRRAPRVIWAGVSDPPELIDLQMRVSGAAKESGYVGEERPFKGHLTLGRVKSSKGADQLIERLKKLSGTQFGRVFAGSLLFLKSELTPQGPVYSVITRAKLGN